MSGEKFTASKLDDRVLAQILHHTSLAVYHLRVYGAENDQVLQGVDIVVSSVNVLTQSAPLTFEFQDGRQAGFQVQSPAVRVNGAAFEPLAEEAAWVQSVVRLARRSQWGTLTLSCGLTNEEWLEFLKSVSGESLPDTEGDRGPRSAFPHVAVTPVEDGAS